MNVLIAPNSLKEAAKAPEIADAIAEGIQLARPDARLRKMAVADGGDYTLEILLESLNGTLVEVDSEDPLGRPILASYGITEDKKAIIELTKASGLQLLKEEERNPILTSTFGTGLLIKDAVERGCTEIILSLGGSATVDGGAGILQALGVELLDREGQSLPRGGGNLIILDKIHADIPDKYKDLKFSLLCDVEHLLLGEEGAAMIFGKQKGAGPIERMVLERCLTNFGRICEEHSGKILAILPGSGAAGGVPVGISAFFNTTIGSGIEYILKVLGAAKHIKWADVIITAEGSLDHQSYLGKSTAVIASKARQQNKKVICIGGRVPLRVDHPDDLFDAVFSLQNQPMSREESIENTLENIRNTAFEVGRLL